MGSNTVWTSNYYYAFPFRTVGSMEDSSKKFFGDRVAGNSIATNSRSKCLFQKDFRLFSAAHFLPPSGTDGIAIDLTVNTLTVH
jgi:hypothetical protein